MHPNQSFRAAGRELDLAFARGRSFGTLSVNSDPAPLLSHIPFQIDETGQRLEAHLVRSNPISRLLSEPRPAVIAVSGSDGYVSPDWYGIDDQVPTWNYVAVHLRGKLYRLPDEQLHPILERLSASMEAKLLPKMPWTIDKMTPEIYERMLRQIVPIAMDIETVDGTWKLSQNKSDEVRLRAAEAIANTDAGSEVRKLSELMRSPPNVS